MIWSGLKVAAPLNRKWLHVTLAVAGHVDNK